MAAAAAAAPRGRQCKPIQCQWAIWWTIAASRRVYSPGCRRASPKDVGAPSERCEAQKSATAEHHNHRCSAPASPRPHREQRRKGLTFGAS